MGLFKRLFFCADCDDKNDDIVEAKKTIQDYKEMSDFFHEECLRLGALGNSLKTENDRLKEELVRVRGIAPEEKG